LYLLASLAVGCGVLAYRHRATLARHADAAYQWVRRRLGAKGPGPEWHELEDGFGEGEEDDFYEF
jgi:hypothetical protein